MYHPIQKIICPSARALNSTYENLVGLNPQLKNLNSQEITFSIKIIMFILQMFQ